MIYGIGTDVVEVSRIKQSLDKYGARLAKKILTLEEMEAFQASSLKENFLAKRFAAKEAFSKAIGTGISKGINFNEIIVHNIKSGKPNIKLLGNTKKIVNRILNKKKFNIFLSLSDDKPFAVATVVISI